jgi:hypothetical protein
MVMTPRGRILLEPGSYDELVYKGKVIGSIGVHLSPDDEFICEVHNASLAFSLKPKKR